MMKLFFEDPWERSGGWNDAQWSTLTGHGLEVGGRGCQKKKKSRKDYRFYKLQWLVKTGSQKKILRHSGVQSRWKWHAGAFGTTPGVQNPRKWPKILHFFGFPGIFGRKCLKQTAGRHIVGHGKAVGWWGLHHPITLPYVEVCKNDSKSQVSNFCMENGHVGG